MFHALHKKFAQSTAQMFENKLYQVKSQLGPTYSQTPRFFVNILIFKDNSSFDQGLTIIPQGMLQIHQNSKVAKLGFLSKSQPNFDQA